MSVLSRQIIRTMRFVFLALSIILGITGLVFSGLGYLEKYVEIQEGRMYLIAAIPTSLVLSTISYFLYSRVKYSDVESREKEIKKEADLIASQRIELKDAKSQIEEIEQLNSRNENLNRIIQSSENHAALAENIIVSLSKEIDACQGIFYVTQNIGGVDKLRLSGAFAFNKTSNEEVIFEFGEGLAGQVAQEGKLMSFDNIPDGYIEVLSGLGKSSPSNLCLFPLLYSDKVLGLIEIASFENFTKGDLMLFERLQLSLGAALNLLNLQLEIKSLRS